MLRRRPLLPLVLAAAAALALVGCDRPEPEAPTPRAVRTTVVDTGEAALAHEFAAELKARQESRLGFRVGGKVTARHVELGQSVRAGQLLAEIDPADLKLAAQAARSAVEAAEVAAAQATADHVRFENLHRQGFISAAELQRRETALQSARAQLEQARAQAAVQSNQSGYSRLTAPADGVVTAVLAEPATVVQAGQPVIALAVNGPRDAVFSVPEDRVDAVRALVGQPGALQVRLWGDGRAQPATVREVAAAADGVTRTFRVTDELAGDAAQAGAPALGRTAVVTMPGPRLDGQVKLPLPALFERSGRTVVWVLDPATMTVRTQGVVLLGADGNEALIGAGLEAGAEVVTAGVHVLAEGQKVVRYQATPAAAPGMATPAQAAAARQSSPAAPSVPSQAAAATVDTTTR